MASPGRTKLLKSFPQALHQGYGAFFVGAGISRAAGYPTWSELLKDIGEELGVHSHDISDLAALAQWHITERGNATGVRNVIKSEIGVDRPVPESLEVIARLPARHIWTTNYDRLVERAFETVRRPIDPVSAPSDLTLKPKPGAAHLYKMHGSIDRLDDIVISTEDYELYRSRRGAFLPLLQAHLTSMSMLFVGLSLTDPNIRQVLSTIRESFAETPGEHFAIVKPPARSDFKTDAEFEARAAQHRLWAQDLRRYGLITVEVDEYSEIPELLKQIERRVASMRVWVSGSWPLEGSASGAADLYRLSEGVGGLIGRIGRDLVSGSGVLVGSAAIAGFIDALRQEGGWDLDRRLIVRPFLQPLEGKDPDRTQWAALRVEMSRYAGVVIFLGGAKLQDGILVDADGVFAEYEAARAAGAFILPVGATGGAAKAIADNIRGSDIPTTGVRASRPTDDELDRLGDPNNSSEILLAIIGDIINRLSKVD
ncbi:SIR2 family protein [Brevundimonas sp. GCM10030266]|uniref:SIR2 family protein n=1 Tax=Brevundimonas sp. GCM10030266 TaxID=3273386 RepID=UPI003616A335